MKEKFLKRNLQILEDIRNTGLYDLFDGETKTLICLIIQEAAQKHNKPALKYIHQLLSIFIDDALREEQTDECTNNTYDW